jgi:LytS/YehU family sensor histidine kinase
VTARRLAGDVEYVVSDDGVGLGDDEPAHGTGLTNVARRLELLFGDRYTLVVTPRVPHGVMVTARFPASE